MSDQPGITAPMNFKIRHPEDPNQKNGAILNPVRYGDFGGLDSAAKWPKGNEMKVESPTSMKTAVGVGKKI